MGGDGRFEDAETCLVCSERPKGPDAPDRVRAAVEAIDSAESRRVFPALIRLLGRLRPRQEALHDASKAALEHSPRGRPANIRESGSSSA